MRPQLGAHLSSLALLVFLLIGSVVPFGCLQEAPTPSVEGGVAVLLALLQDKNPEIRRTAVESLGKIGDPSALPAVLPLLSDPVASVRAASAQALGRMATPAHDSVIAGLAHALRDTDDRVREAAALAIADIEPSSRQLAPVRDLLRASDVEVRRSAVRGLVSLDMGKGIDWLLPLVDDPDAEVRQGAVAALGFSGDVRAGFALGKRLVQDPSPGVRAEAAYHLGKLNGQNAYALLRAAVEKETDPGVRRWIEAELKALRVND